MKILIIDSSSERSLLAICEGVDPIFIKELPIGFKSSQQLVDALQIGFQEVGMSVADLSAIATTVGPGLFTGVRAGAALAKGLAFNQSLPLIGLSSLSAFIHPDEGEFASVIDARIGGGYVLLQERHNNQIFEQSHPQFVSKEDLTGFIGPRPIVGPGFPRLGFTDALITYPDAAYLAYLANQKFHLNEFDQELDLLYLEKPLSDDGYRSSAIFPPISTKT